MIGTGALASRTAVLLLAMALLSGDGNQAAGDAAALVWDRARAAVDTLDGLGSALRHALDEARTGASRTVQGDQAPGKALSSAAELVEDAREAAKDAVAAVSAFDGVRRAQDPSVPPLPAAVQPAELQAVADELRAAASSADAFAGMRRRSTDLLKHVDGALANLVNGRLTEAGTEVRAARADHDALLGWTVGSGTMLLWLGTTDAMISAVTALIDAGIANDPEAAARASAELAAIGSRASEADRALRIAIAEGAAEVTSPALQRLAAAIADVDELRIAVAGDVGP